MTSNKIEILSTSGLSTPAPTLPDGVWLNLAEPVYFSQDRLGSTDMSRLYLRKEGYWWSSHLNPAVTRDRGGHMDYGKALHKAILEGDEAFRESIYVMPDKESLRAATPPHPQYGERFCVTTKDIVEALERRGMHPKANQPKDWFVEYCRTRAPDLVIWDVAVAKAEQEAKDKILLTAAERRDIELMARIVHEHHEIGPLFQPGPDNLPMPEVTVLFTDEHGLQRRVRFDDLLPQNIIDLKSISGVGNRDIKFFAGEHVASLAYHVQMADHLYARRFMLKMIQAGMVYDGHPVDLRTKESQERFKTQRAWLARFPEEAPNSDYAWIFYQKPDAKAGHAPIVFPWGEDLGGELHRRGIRCRREAVATYRRCMEQFGPDEPWVRVEPLHTSREGVPSSNRVVVPHWIGGDTEVPGEEEDL